MIQDIEKKNEDITTQFAHFNRMSNIFSIFKHERHEDANSNMLAWLLDANEKHGLKDAFIMALIEKLNIDSTPFKTAKVYREYTFTDGDEKDKKARRIDILIKTENSTNILVIENKIYSSEHTGQLLAYMNHINKVYGEKSAVTFVKLSPCGDLPSQDISKTRGEDGWKVLSYADILSCLLQMQQKTMPLDTRTIISNYIDYLRFSLCVDKKIMDVVKDTDVEKREKDKERLCDEIGEVLPKENTYLEKKSGVYYLRFTTPQIDKYIYPTQNTSENNPSFWDGHSYAFEFIITDSDLTFQLCFLEEDNKTDFKDLEDKFVYDKHEQIQPRNKTSRWIVLRKESFIFNGNNWDGLSKFISECQEYLKRWEQEVCSKDSGIKFNKLFSFCSENAKKRLREDIGAVLPKKNITTHSEEKSGVYYLRFTTPQIDTYMKDNDPTQAAQNTSKKAPFWDGHSYAFEFIITDSDLTFQLCFLEEDNKTDFKDLEDKFVYDKHEQIQPRNKTSRWIVLRKESFIFNGNNWDGLSKFISDCQKYLERWEQEVCSGYSSGIEFNPLDAYKELFDSTSEFKAKYVSNFRYYLANKIYAILDKYYKDNLISYFASNEKDDSINIKFFTSNQQNLKSEELNLRYTEGICNGCRNGNRFGKKECSTDNDEQYNACERFWENKHHFTREIIIKDKDKEVVAQFVIKCTTLEEAKEIQEKYAKEDPNCSVDEKWVGVVWCQQTIKFENQTTEDIVAQIEAYIKKCTNDEGCRALTP